MVDQNKTPLTEEEKAIEHYVEGLIREKKDPNVNEKNFKEVKDFLTGEIVDAINKKMISLLSDAKIDELNAMLDRNASETELGAFFEKEIPDRAQIITQIFLDFRTGYLSVAPAPRDNLEKISTTLPTVIQSTPEVGSKPVTLKKDEILAAPPIDMMDTQKKGKMPSPVPSSVMSSDKKRVVN